MAEIDISEVTARKIEELNEMSVSDDNFKDAANAVSNLMETQAKIENQKEELKVKKRDSIWGKIGLVATGIIVPFVLNALNNSRDDSRLDKVLEYEKTGVVMSTGGKNVVNSMFRRKH